MKRKFKLLFIAISICAMLFAFAISSSASNYIDLSEYDFSDGVYSTVFLNTYKGSGSDFISSSPEEFGLCYFGNSIGYSYGFINIEFWDSLIISQNVQNVSDFSNLASFLINNGYICDLGSDGIGYEVASNAEFYYNVYLSYKQQQSLKYTQEDIDSAVTEATKDMYTQSQLDEAVAKALEDAGVVLGNGMVMSPSFPENLGDGLPTFAQYGSVDEIENSFNYLRFNLYLEEGGTSDYIYIVDINGFKNFCSSNNITTASEFHAYMNTLMNSFEAYSAPYNYCNCISSIGFLNEGEIFNYFYNYENPPTEDDLQAKYDEGKVAGATEYKSSEEYATALNNKYSAGYTEGIESFKSSNAYTDALDLQYSNGKTAGVTEYKASTEYANALEAEYNEGYDNGVADTEGENTKNTITRLVSILIGVLGFGILFLGVLSAVGTFKMKRKHR